MCLLITRATQVDAGAFRNAKEIHSFLGLPAALDLIYNKVPEDTLVLSATITPFDRGTAFVKSATLSGIMDLSDRLQGGWYGGRKSAIAWWERETRKVTTIQAGLQRFAPSSGLNYFRLVNTSLCLKIRREGAASLDAGRATELA